MWLRSLVVCRCGGGASAGRGSSLYSPRNLIVSEILFILFYLFHIITIQVRCKRQNLSNKTVATAVIHISALTSVWCCLARKLDYKLQVLYRTALEGN